MSRGKPSGHAWATGALELNSEQSVKERKMRGRPSRRPAVAGEGAGFVASPAGYQTAMILQVGGRI